MKLRLLICSAAIAIATAAPAKDIRETGLAPNAPIVVQFDAIPTGSLVTMLLRDVMRVPYVIAPDVLSDRRATSVNLRIPRNDVPSSVVGYLRRTGFTVELNGGTIYVGRVGGAARGFSSYGGGSVPFGSPVDMGDGRYPVASQSVSPPRVSYPAPADLGMSQGSLSKPGQSSVQSEQAANLVAYVPAHRSPDYLSSVIGPLMPGVSFGARKDVAPDREAETVLPNIGPDVLVFGCSSADLPRVKRLLQTLDRPRPMVAIKSVVMQMNDVQTRGSALNILVSLGKGKVQGGSFPAISPAGPQFVRIATGAVQAMLSAVHEDSRFRVVASPNLAALSGEVATMNAGASVPTVGNVTFPEGGGGAVQSVVYRDSGITLTVRPVVRGDLIEMEVRQERSTFTKTATGVEDSPTLNKASTAASVVMKSGESVILAGLTETSSGHTREGLFGGLLGVRSRDKSDSELLIVLQAELVPLPATEPGQFIDIDASPGEDNGTPTDPLAPNPRRAGIAV